MSIAGGFQATVKLVLDVTLTTTSVGGDGAKTGKRGNKAGGGGGGGDMIQGSLYFNCHTYNYKESTGYTMVPGTAYNKSMALYILLV